MSTTPGATTQRRTPGRSRDAVDRALAEDLGPEGDLTSALVPEDVRAQFALRARRSGVLAGCDCVTETYRRVGPEIDLRWRASDGDELSAGDTVLELAGPLRPSSRPNARR